MLRYIAETRLREVFVGFSLLLVIGIALLMESVGLSMALGAFLAGVLLADSEYRHELELDIEPFKGLLLGLVLHRRRHVDRPRACSCACRYVVLGVALGIVALKIAILFPIAQLFGYCGRADAGAVRAWRCRRSASSRSCCSAPRRRVLPPRDAGAAERGGGGVHAHHAAPLHASTSGCSSRARTRARAAGRDRRSRNAVIVAGFGRFGQVVARVLQRHAASAPP